jgi:hypothetical protein
MDLTTSHLSSHELFPAYTSSSSSSFYPTLASPSSHLSSYPLSHNTYSSFSPPAPCPSPPSYSSTSWDPSPSPTTSHYSFSPPSLPLLSICPTSLLQSSLVPDPSFGSVRRPKPVRASRGQQELMMQNEVYVLKLMMGGSVPSSTSLRGAVSKRTGGRRATGKKSVGMGKMEGKRGEPLSVMLELLGKAERNVPPAGGSMMACYGGGMHWVGGCTG